MEKKISRIEIDTDTNAVTFFFDDERNEPFDILEFVPESLTRKHLERIVYEIHDYNSEVDLCNEGG